jgi:iron(III) transport system substrate-binding protein
MRKTSKWTVLVGLALVWGSACAPGAAPATAPVQSGAARQPPEPTGAAAADTSWPAEWDRTLAAARQEGKVIVKAPQGDTFRGMLMAFQGAYPDIPVEVTGGSGRDFASTIMSERRADRYLWDVYVGGADTVLHVLHPEGVIDPLRPMLIRPEITDDAYWLNGFDWPFMDSPRQYVRSFATSLTYAIHVNRDVVSEAEFSRVEDLLNPRFRRRISFNEPREAGGGAEAATTLLRTMGPDGLRALLRDQELVVTRDIRQQIEWLVRGQYPIALGVNPARIDDFRRQGLGLNIRPLPGVFDVGLSGAGCSCAVNRAPHPNAAKVYLDWLLSPQGQAIWNKSSGLTSLRTDVAPEDPSQALTPGVEYLISAREENAHLRDAAVKLAKETLP